MAADHADISVPPECREMIRAGALLASVPAVARTARR